MATSTSDYPQHHNLGMSSAKNNNNHFPNNAGNHSTHPPAGFNPNQRRGSRQMLSDGNGQDRNSGSRSSSQPRDYSSSSVLAPLSSRETDRVNSKPFERSSRRDSYELNRDRLVSAQESLSALKEKTSALTKAFSEKNSKNKEFLSSSRHTDTSEKAKETIDQRRYRFAESFDTLISDSVASTEPYEPSIGPRRSQSMRALSSSKTDGLKTPAYRSSFLNSRLKSSSDNKSTDQSRPTSTSSATAASSSVAKDKTATTFDNLLAPSSEMAPSDPVEPTASFMAGIRARIRRGSLTELTQEFNTPVRSRSKSPAPRGSSPRDLLDDPSNIREGRQRSKPLFPKPRHRSLDRPARPPQEMPRRPSVGSIDVSKLEMPHFGYESQFAGKREHTSDNTGSVTKSTLPTPRPSHQLPPTASPRFDKLFDKDQSSRLLKTNHTVHDQKDQRRDRANDQSQWLDHNDQNPIDTVQRSTSHKSPDDPSMHKVVGEKRRGSGPKHDISTIMSRFSALLSQSIDFDTEEEDKDTLDLLASTPTDPDDFSQLDGTTTKDYGDNETGYKNAEDTTATDRVYGGRDKTKPYSDPISSTLVRDAPPSRLSSSHVTHTETTRERVDIPASSSLNTKRQGLNQGGSFSEDFNSILDLSDQVFTPRTPSTSDYGEGFAGSDKNDKFTFRSTSRDKENTAVTQQKPEPFRVARKLNGRGTDSVFLGPRPSLRDARRFSSYEVLSSLSAANIAKLSALADETSQEKPSADEIFPITIKRRSSLPIVLDSQQERAKLEQALKHASEIHEKYTIGLFSPIERHPKMLRHSNYHRFLSDQVTTKTDLLPRTERRSSASGKSGLSIGNQFNFEQDKQQPTKPSAGLFSTTDSSLFGKTTSTSSGIYDKTNDSSQQSSSPKSSTGSTPNFYNGMGKPDSSLKDAHYSDTSIQSEMPSFETERRNSTPSLRVRTPLSTTKVKVTADGKSYNYIDSCESELELTKMLQASEDFNERRRIRARMRELKTPQRNSQDTIGDKPRSSDTTFADGQPEHVPRLTSSSSATTTKTTAVSSYDNYAATTESGGETTADAEADVSYEGVTSLAELQKLLAESSDAVERHKIRSVIRQLRQTDTEQLKSSKPPRRHSRQSSEQQQTITTTTASERIESTSSTPAESTTETYFVPSSHAYNNNNNTAITDTSTSTTYNRATSKNNNNESSSTDNTFLRPEVPHKDEDEEPRERRYSSEFLNNYKNKYKTESKHEGTESDKHRPKESVLSSLQTLSVTQDVPSVLVSKASDSSALNEYKLNREEDNSSSIFESRNAQAAVDNSSTVQNSENNSVNSILENVKARLRSRDLESPAGFRKKPDDRKDYKSISLETPTSAVGDDTVFQYPFINVEENKTSPRPAEKASDRYREARQQILSSANLSADLRSTSPSPRAVTPTTEQSTAEPFIDELQNFEEVSNNEKVEVKSGLQENKVEPSNQQPTTRPEPEQKAGLTDRESRPLSPKPSARLGRRGSRSRLPVLRGKTNVLQAAKLRDEKKRLEASGVLDNNGAETAEVQPVYPKVVVPEDGVITPDKEEEELEDSESVQLNYKVIVPDDIEPISVTKDDVSTQPFNTPKVLADLNTQDRAKSEEPVFKVEPVKKEISLPKQTEYIPEEKSLPVQQRKEEAEFQTKTSTEEESSSLSAQRTGEDEEEEELTIYDQLDRGIKPEIPQTTVNALKAKFADVTADLDRGRQEQVVTVRRSRSLHSKVRNALPSETATAFYVVGREKKPGDAIASVSQKQDLNLVESGLDQPENRWRKTSDNVEVRLSELRKNVEQEIRPPEREPIIIQRRHSFTRPTAPAAAPGEDLQRKLSFQGNFDIPPYRENQVVERRQSFTKPAPVIKEEPASESIQVELRNDRAVDVREAQIPLNVQPEESLDTSVTSSTCEEEDEEDAIEKLNLELRSDLSEDTTEGREITSRGSSLKRSKPVSRRHTDSALSDKYKANFTTSVLDKIDERRETPKDSTSSEKDTASTTPTPTARQRRVGVSTTVAPLAFDAVIEPPTDFSDINRSKDLDEDLQPLKSEEPEQTDFSDTLETKSWIELQRLGEPEVTSQTSNRLPRPDRYSLPTGPPTFVSSASLSVAPATQVAQPIRRHSEVLRGQKPVAMEQAFSSLLDDLEKVSSSEGNPSDLELSDGEDTLAFTGGLTELTAHATEVLGSKLSSKQEASETTDSLNAATSVQTFSDIKTKPAEKYDDVETEQNKISDTKSLDIPDIDDATPRTDITSSATPLLLSSTDSWSKEDSGIELALDDGLIQLQKDDVKRQRPLSSSSFSSSASTSPLPATALVSESLKTTTEQDIRDEDFLNQADTQTSDKTAISLEPVKSPHLTESVAMETITPSHIPTNAISTSKASLENNNNNVISNISNNNIEKNNNKDPSTHIGTRTFSVNQDDDGGVTMQAVAEDEHQNRIVTVRTKKQRTPSNANEELRDTIMERRKMTPGGSVVQERDVIQTKRRLTSRGSNYYQRSVYTTRLKRDKEGAEKLEHDVVVETENKSVTQGKAWGDRAVTHVTVGDQSEDSNQLSSSATLSIENGSQVETLEKEIEEKNNEELMNAANEVKKTEGPPVIVQALRDQTTIEGRHVSLDLCVLAMPTPGVTWLKDGEPLVDADGYVCRLDSDTGKASLSFDSASIFDTALFTCVCKNEVGETTTQCRLVVKRRPEHPPVFETKLHDVTITEGHSTILTCRIAEAESVAWYKDGIVQRNSSDFKQTFDGHEASLEIGEVFLDDVGEYSCVAKNEVGENRSSCRLDVVASEMGSTVVPMFLTKLPSPVVSDGDNLLLECDVIGCPEPEITWVKDGLELDPQLTYSTCYDGRVASLTIEGMRLEDAGLYTCVAENLAGKVSMGATVTVQVKNKPPHFTSTMNDVSIHVGQSVTLRCEVLGTPQPAVLWRREGLLVGTAHNFIQSYNNGTARLEILGVAKQDEGTYECVAKNTVGEVTCSCQLKVIEPKASEPKPRAEGSVLPPRTTVRRTFKKLSEPRPADIISAVLQRAASNAGAPPAQRAQSFSPDSTSLEDNTVPGSKFSENSFTAAANEDVKEEETPSATSLGQAQSVATLNLVYSPPETMVLKRERIILKGPIGRKISQDSLENASASGGESARSDISTTSGSSADAINREVPKRHKAAVNLGRSASMHVVRNNTSLSPLQSPSSGIKPVWTPPSKEELLQTNESLSSASSLEMISETQQQQQRSASPIAGYRPVSPMFLTSQGRDKPPPQPISPLVQNDQSVQSVQNQSVSKSEQSSEARTPTAQDKDSIGRDLTQGGPLVSAIAKMMASETSASTISPQLPKEPAPSSTTTTAPAPSEPEAPVAPPRKKNSLKNETLAAEQLPQKQQPTSDKPQPVEPPVISSADERESSFSSSSDISSSDESDGSRGSQSSRSSRVSELRAQFLQKEQAAAADRQKQLGPGSTSGGIRRWQSMPPQNVRPNVVKRDKAPPANRANMPNYEEINDEEELHKLMNATEDFDERKKIRARLREIRDKQKEEWEAKRKQREAEVEDLVKKKFEKAEEEKKKKMAAYKQQAPTHERDSKYQAASQKLIDDKHKLADEEKAKRLEAYSKISENKTGASGEKISSTTTTTTQKTPGGTKTVITKKTETSSQGFGGVQYGKPAAETARELTEQLMRSTSGGTSGKITVKTESWNSQDNRVQTTEKTQTWGAKPQGAKSAMAAFKQMDAANPAPGGAKANGAPGADDEGRPMARSPSAIKQVLLDWTKAMTQGYPNVEVTNFSSSWNNGMAFCALIHHFYPDAFDFSKLDPKQRRYNFTLAFDTAEQKADIAPLLDVEDMVKMKNPDWKCVFTYVQSMYRHLKDHENNKATAPPPEQ